MLSIRGKTIQVISDECVVINEKITPLFDLEKADFYALMDNLFSYGKVRFMEDIILDKNCTVFMPSVINVNKNLGLTYYSYRSVFSARERLAQTIEGIRSVASAAQSVDKKVVLLEGSKLDLYQIGELLKEKCIICLTDSTGYNYANFAKNKSLYEVYMLREMMKKANGDCFSKLGGRYGGGIHHAENKGKFKILKGFCPIDVIECINWVIPKIYFPIFIRAFDEFLKILVETERKDIEILLTNFLMEHKELWEPVEWLGINGKDAIYGKIYRV